MASLPSEKEFLSTKESATFANACCAVFLGFWQIYQQAYTPHLGSAPCQISGIARSPPLNYIERHLW
jgi:hypothetical protein